MSQHVLSLRTHFVVFAVLMVLTVVTVAVSTVDLGAWNTVVALLIASVKGLVVIAWFMHVKFSTRLTKIFVGAGFVWLVLLILIMTSDYSARGWL